MEWLTYLLKVSACMAFFYAFYHLCLQRLTFFNVNRIYLLSTLIISFIIPVLQLKVERQERYSNQFKEETAVYTGNFTDLQKAAVSPNPVPKAIDDATSINWQQVLLASYWLIVILMLSIFALQAIQLLKHTRQVNQKIGRLKVVFKQEGFTNCSFLNYVFLNRQELSDEETAVILHHENVHISRYHSVDKLVIAACKALLWFNPLVYLYDKALEQVHEYEADKETSTAVGNTPYANILLTIAVRKRNPSLAHSFVRNPLKGRIKMLFTNQSKNMKKLVYLAVLPIGLVLTWAFAVQVVYASPHEPKLKETVVKSFVQVEKVPSRVVPYRELKTEKRPVLNSSSDTLWMIDYPSLSKYSEVVINGKSYDADILTKMSPRGIKTVSGSVSGKLEIATWDGKLEYATKIDRENVIIRKRAFASGMVYVRYPQKRQDGSRYDEISIKLKNGAGGSVGLDKGEKILLLFDGKQYSEREFKALAADYFKDCNVSFRSGVDKDEEIKAKYGKGYGSMIKISKFATDSIKKEDKGVFRRPIGMKIEDGNGKFSYSAQDSTIYKGFANVLLYGDVKMSNDQISIKADKVKFNGTYHIALAKNASFTQKGKAEVKDVPFVRFNLRAGTYKVLQEIKGF